jgi:hypothetical protein
MRSALVLATLFFTYAAFEVYFRFHPSHDIQVNDSYGYLSLALAAKHQDGSTSWIRHDFPLQFDERAYYKKSDGAIYYFSDQFGARWISKGARRLKTKPVLVLGDSLTFGFGVRAEDTFSQRLEEKLKVPFLNFAAPGADSGGALTQYEKSSHIPHRMAMYGLNLNDLIDFTTNYVAENQLLGNSFVKHSKFADFLARRWDRFYGRKRRIRSITSSAALETPIFKGNFAAILKLNARAKERKAPLIVALLPTLVDLKKKTFAPVYAEIIKRLKENGVETVDLTEGLDTYRDEDLWILPFDQHPNEIAHGIFAEKLDRYLSEKNRLR